MFDVYKCPSGHSFTRAAVMPPWRDEKIPCAHCSKLAIFADSIEETKENNGNNGRQG